MRSTDDWYKAELCWLFTYSIVKESVLTIAVGYQGKLTLFYREL